MEVANQYGPVSDAGVTASEGAVPLSTGLFPFTVLIVELAVPGVEVLVSPVIWMDMTVPSAMNRE